MSRSLRRFWGANALFCLGLSLHCGEARVYTEVQAGPLYRVVGSPLSISCNVSGFASASARKDFEFRFKKPDKPTLEYNVISTGDQGFSYAMYSDRVRSKEVTLTHLSPNSVIFEIRSLQKSDEGEFDCTVINTEAGYDGVYSAKIAVKVIDNSLSVSSPDPTSLSFNEGDALTLNCQASSNTVQHTHLSLAWYLHKNDEDDARLIISLDRGFTLTPGRGFEERYKAGLIRLDKTGEATYKLSISQLELSDQGGVYCRAQEWIQDPDRSWYSIAQKDAGETTLRVQTREVVSDTPSVSVRISAQPATLQEGQGLSLSCTIDTRNLEERFFSVAWLKGDAELARVGPTGIVSVGPEYSMRAEEGELRAARIGARDYRLVLRPVTTGDRGEYACRAWPQDRGQDGGFTRGAAQDSISQLVSISTTESGLSLEMQSTLDVNEGGGLVLTCKVIGVKGRLSVAWTYKAASTPAAALASVVSLSQEGVVEKGGEFGSRKVRATRPATDTFTMELDEVTPSDSGVYQCAVSEWKINSKIHGQSKAATVRVAPADSFVKVKLISRNNIVTVGENAELICQVVGLHPGLPITLAWSLQRDASTPDNILTVYSDGAISWSAGQHRYQLRVDSKRNKITHYLLINGASHREAGRYQCTVSVFLENVHKHLPPSNQLAVSVQNPENQLSIRQEEMELNVSTSQNFSIPCHITKQSSRESEFQVIWFWQRETDTEQRPIFAVYRNSTLQMFGEGDQLSFSHPSPDQFSLAVLQPGPEDSGHYFCEVEEWLPSPSHGWTKLAVEKSGFLTVNVYADGNTKAVHEPECSMPTWMWILLVIIIFALLVIVLLALKMCRSKGGNKSRQPLWAEQHRLNAKPSAED